MVIFPLVRKPIAKAGDQLRWDKTPQFHVLAGLPMDHLGT